MPVAGMLDDEDLAIAGFKEALGVQVGKPVKQQFVQAHAAELRIDVIDYMPDQLCISMPHKFCKIAIVFTG